MNGAIQQIVWHVARLPKAMVGTNSTTSTISATIAACKSATEMPCHVR
jgi:hypothetical protein